MAMSQLILARRDAACGKVFHDNRRTAEEHRIALEIWNRATGRAKENCRLAVFHCKRCGGFHISQKRIDLLDKRTHSRPLENEINQDLVVTKIAETQHGQSSENGTTDHAHHSVKTAEE